MKCVCGYKHESGYNDDMVWDKNLRGDEPFMPLIGSDTYFEVQVLPGSFKRLKVNLYVCPKCGTIKMEK